ncbi:MAG: hypothetical protein ACYS9Y_14340 [Planctomycetota bacterium]|jgi:hypothetical protein
MRPSEKFEAKPEGQNASPGVVYSTLRTFWADDKGSGLPLGIERVIGIGSKSRRNSLAVIFNHCGIDTFSFRRWRFAFSLLLAKSPLPAKAVKEITEEPKENYKWQNP